MYRIWCAKCKRILLKILNLNIFIVYLISWNRAGFHIYNYHSTLCTGWGWSWVQTCSCFRHCCPQISEILRFEPDYYWEPHQNLLGCNLPLRYWEVCQKLWMIGLVIFVGTECPMHQCTRPPCQCVNEYQLLDEIKYPKIIWKDR